MSEERNADSFSARPSSNDFLYNNIISHLRLVENFLRYTKVHRNFLTGLSGNIETAVEETGYVKI